MMLYSWRCQCRSRRAGKRICLPERWKWKYQVCCVLLHDVVACILYSIAFTVQSNDFSPIGLLAPQAATLVLVTPRLSTPTQRRQLSVAIEA